MKPLAEMTLPEIDAQLAHYAAATRETLKLSDIGHVENLRSARKAIITFLREKCPARMHSDHNPETCMGSCCTKTGAVVTKPRTTSEHLADQTVLITLHYVTTTLNPQHVECVMASPGIGMADMPANTDADKRAISDAVEHRADLYRRQGYQVDILTIDSKGVEFSP